MDYVRAWSARRFQKYQGTDLFIAEKEETSPNRITDAEVEDPEEQFETAPSTPPVCRSYHASSGAERPGIQMF